MSSLDRGRRATLAGWACLACLAVWPAAAARAQQHVHSPEEPAPASTDRPRPTVDRGAYQIQAMRAGRVIEVDGLLIDEAWRSAPMIDSFTQQEPVNGEPATERTEVRILYDSGNLYIGVHAFDSDPDHLVATEMRRDSARIMD